MESLPYSPAEPVNASTLSLETRIALLARRLWEEYGRPDDCDLAIWMEAERRVLRMLESVSELACGVTPAPSRRTAS